MTKHKIYYDTTIDISQWLFGGAGSSTSNSNNTSAFMTLTNKDDDIFDGARIMRTIHMDYLKYALMGGAFLSTPIVIYDIIITVLFFMFSLLRFFVIIVCKTKLTYKQSARLFAVAATPSIIIFLLANIFNFFTGVLGIGLVLLIMIYYIGGELTLKRLGSQLIVL